MDGIMEVILLHLLVHVGQKVVIGHTDNQLHPYSLRVFESPINLRLTLHVNRSHSIACHLMGGTLRMESLDLLVRAVERQMEILDAEVMNVQALQGLEGRL